MNEDIFDSIRQETLSEGPLAAAGKLVDWFRAKGDLRELFEALKMQSRIKLGISAVAVEGDAPLTSQQQDVLERDLIDACREDGLGFLNRGNLEEGWMYMRPVGDRAATAEALAQVPVTGDNLDAMLQLLVHEAIDVARGTRLSLEHRGTCNTITMMESVVRMRGRPEQQAGVRELVLHVHHELLTSLKNDITLQDFSALKKPVFINSVVQTLADIHAPEHVLRINGWPTFLSRTVWEITGQVNENVDLVFQSLNIKINLVKDEPGFITARIIAMIVNEAYFAVEDDVSSKDEIDIAMRLGTNYPFGPFEWAKLIGTNNILALLQKLNTTDNRYLPSKLLIKEVTEKNS